MDRKWRNGVVAVALSCAMGQSMLPYNVLNLQAKETVKSVTSVESFKQIRDYWRSELIGSYRLQNDDTDFKEMVESLDEKTKKYSETMSVINDDTKELWDDELFMQAAVGARVTEALDRLKLMSIQLMQPSSVYYKSEKLKKQIIKAYQFILDEKYGPDTASFGGNWWDKEIGAPKAMVDIAILLYDEFNKEQITAITETIDRFIPKADYRLNSSFKETGANLCDKVANVIKRAALDGNNERLQHASGCMDPLFGYVTKGDGYYTDGSFIQHNNIPYNGSYGYVLLDELTNCIIMLSMSEEAIASENIEFFNNVLIENYLPFISYGGNVVDNVRGRAVSRFAQQGDTMGMQMMGVLLQYADVADSATRNKLLTGIKGIVDEKFAEKQTQDFSMLKYADYARVKELASSSDINKIKRNSYQVFSNMDRMVAHRDGYTFTIAPSSNRMYNTEQGNQENLLGRYQGQGYYQIYNNDISQYNDHYNATVDSDRISGVTTAHQDISFGTQGQSPWTGGATLDGIVGSAGAILTGEKKLSTIGTGGVGSEVITNVVSGITAEKSYFVLNDSVVCIGSNISNMKTDENVSVLETIVDNRKVQDNKLYIDGIEMQSTDGTTAVENPKYAYLTGNDAVSGMGYVFLEDANITLKRETRKNAWSDVNKLAKFTNTEERTGKYVSLAVDHGVDANNSSYRYVILPNASKEETQSYQVNEHVKVLHAQDGIHAIKDLDSNQTMMNFYKAGSVENVKVNQPVSMVMKSENGQIELAVSDPTHSLTSVDITLKNVETKKQDVIKGNAKVIDSGSDWMTIRVNFSTKDGQSNLVTLGTSYKVASSNLALNKDVEASSVVQNSATQTRLPEFAVDGDAGTRWASNYERGNPSISTEEADKGWFLIDLGKEESFNQIDLFWESAYSSEYKIYIANSKKALEDTSQGICNIASGCKEIVSYTRDDLKKENKTDKFNFDEVTGRYVKIQSFNRPKLTSGLGYGGLSLFEIEIKNSLSLRDLMTKAETLMKDYPKESFVNQNEFAQANQGLTDAITNAEALMALGNTYEDSALRDVAQQLNVAIRTYDAGVNHVTGIAIDQEDMTMQKNTDTTLTYAFTPFSPYNKNVTWKSSDSKIVRVDQKGNIKAITSGVATITVTSQDGNFNDSIIVTVDVKPESITLDQTEISLTRNDSVTLNAKVLPEDALDKTAKWTSSNSDIAVVDENGTVTANKVGRVVIKAETINGLTAECIVNVTANKNVRGKNVALNGKATASSQVNATANPENAIDGNYDTRWASNYKVISEEEAENQWLLIELPEVAEFNQIDLTWFSETVYGKEYKILVSMDNQNFEEAIHVKNGKNKTYTMKFDTVKAKYVKFQGIKRSATGGGYGIVEMDVYRNHNFDEIITKAKEIMNVYPSELTNQVDAFNKLKTAVEVADQLLIDNPNFESNELYDVLVNVETAYNEYVKYIIPVQDMNVTDKLSVKADKTGMIHPIFTPENATNTSVTYASSDETIVKVDQDGTVHGVRPGTATITVTSVDKRIAKEVLVTITSNTKPEIHANGVVLILNNKFNPLTNVTVTDAEDGTIALTKENVIKNTVDTSKEGFYEVIYQVTDSDGNTVEKTITVQVRQAMNIYQILSKNNVSIQGYLMEQSILNVKDLKDEINSYQLLLPEHFQILQMINIELIHEGKEILPNGSVRVSVKIDDWKEITDVLVFQKDETYRKLDFDKENGTIMFDTDRLSSIAFVKATKLEDEGDHDTSNPSPEEPEQDNEEKPVTKPEEKPTVKPEEQPENDVNTGDQSNTGILLGTLLLSTMASIGLSKKRKSEKE